MAKGGGERVKQGFMLPRRITCGTCRGSKKVTQLPPRRGGVVDMTKAQPVDCPTCNGSGEMNNPAYGR